VANHIDPLYQFADNCLPVISFETRDEEVVFNENELSLNGFKVYPNPANHLLNITYNGEDNIEYRLYDMQGRLLKSGSFNQATIVETIDYQTGLYMLVLDNLSNQTMEKFKVIINH
jgi:hypothetical protein